MDEVSCFAMDEAINVSCFATDETINASLLCSG